MAIRSCYCAVVRFSVAVLGLLPLLLVCAPASLFAAEGTEIASSFDDDNPFDLFFGVDYAFEAKQTAIKRENEDGKVSVDDKMLTVKDLVFNQVRHIIRPRLQLGIFHDLELTLAVPIIVSDTREYTFDQRSGEGGSCEFTGMRANCINRTNSTTLIDKILPGYEQGATQIGYDANDPISNFSPDSKTVFRGVTRSGIDQLHLGMSWALLNQKRDDTKPTWIVGSELRLSIGKLMKFDRLAPKSEDGVSRGVHDIRVFTGLSKRTTWADPFVFFWWQAPFALRGENPRDPSSSLFWNTGFGQETKAAQQMAGTTFGFEAIPWENSRQQQKLGIEVQARVEAHFEGIGYSEMWEPFAYGGESVPGQNCLSDAPVRSGVLAVDLDPTTSSDDKCKVSYPGTTEIQNYLTFSGRLGLRGQVGPTAKFSASFELLHDQTHRISFADAGNDDNRNNKVDPNTKEVNPLHMKRIDLAGRRYIADETLVYTFLVSGMVMF